MKGRELANIVNIPINRVHNILHDHFHMRKLSARWVPCLLTLDQKRIRMNISQGCLDKFKRNPTEFLQRFITVDKMDSPLDLRDEATVQTIGGSR